MQQIVERAGDSVLDIGCSTGAYVAFCQALGKRAVGIDIDIAKLAEARKEYQGHFVSASAEALPFRENEFETVLMWDVLEHTSNDRTALSEAIRVAQKNVLISVPKEDGISTPGNGVTYRHYVDLEHKRYYTPENIHNLISSLGSYNVVVEHWCRIRPVAAYARIGVPYRLCAVLESFLWMLSRNKEAFLRNLFVEITF